MAIEKMSVSRQKSEQTKTTFRPSFKLRLKKHCKENNMTEAKFIREATIEKMKGIYGY
jgi:hypothetical protein